MWPGRILLVGLTFLTAPLAAQRVQQIELQNPAPGEFRFAPASLTVGGNDIVEFTVVSGGPYVVGFVAADLAPADRGRLQEAIGGTGGRLRGPVLQGQGASFRVRLPALPAGTYRFESVTHTSYRMQGTLTVR